MTPSLSKFKKQEPPLANFRGGGCRKLCYCNELLIFFYFEFTKNLLILSMLFIFIIFINLFSTLFFFHCMIKILIQVKKKNFIFDGISTAVRANIIDNIRSIFLFLESFLEKILFVLLVSCLLLSHLA